MVHQVGSIESSLSSTSSTLSNKTLWILEVVLLTIWYVLHCLDSIISCSCMVELYNYPMAPSLLWFGCSNWIYDFFSSLVVLHNVLCIPTIWSESTFLRYSLSDCCLFTLCLTKNQKNVSWSSAEAEYRAIASTYCEITWLKHLLTDLNVTHPRPIKLYCDNNATIQTASNPVFHERTEHIAIDYRLIREKL